MYFLILDPHRISRPTAYIK